MLVILNSEIYSQSSCMVHWCISVAKTVKINGKHNKSNTGSNNPCCIPQTSCFNIYLVSVKKNGGLCTIFVILSGHMINSSQHLHNTLVRH